MNSETSIVARQYRLQEWADLVRDCNNRSNTMTVKLWCNQHSISTANYYYRLTEVRKACLETNHISFDQSIVPVPAELLPRDSVSNQTAGIELSVNDIWIRVTQNTSAELLKMVLEVASHVGTIVFLTKQKLSHHFLNPRMQNRQSKEEQRLLGSETTISRIFLCLQSTIH